MKSTKAHAHAVRGMIKSGIKSEGCYLKLTKHFFQNLSYFQQFNNLTIQLFIQCH